MYYPEEIVVKPDLAIYRAAFWSRQKQFIEMKTRGMFCKTWKVNYLTQDTPTVLPVDYMGNTLFNNEDSGNLYITPSAADWIKNFSFQNYVEQYAGMEWFIVNSSNEFPLQINTGPGVGFFDERDFLQVNPRETVTLLIQIQEDLGSLRIYIMNGSTEIGPTGDQGPEGDKGRIGDIGPRGNQGVQGPVGQPADYLGMKPGFVFLPPSFAVQVISPGSNDGTNPFNLANFGSANGLYNFNPAPTIPEFSTLDYVTAVGEKFPTALQSFPISPASSYSFTYPLSSVFPGRTNGPSPTISITSILVYANVCVIGDDVPAANFIKPSAFAYNLNSETPGKLFLNAMPQTFTFQPGLAYTADENDFYQYSGNMPTPGAVYGNSTNLCGMFLLTPSSPLTLSYNQIQSGYITIIIDSINSSHAILFSFYGIGLNVTYDATV